MYSDHVEMRGRETFLTEPNLGGEGHNLGELGLNRIVLRCFYCFFLDVPLAFLRYCPDALWLIPGCFLSVSRFLLLWLFSVSEGVSPFFP